MSGSFSTSASKIKLLGVNTNDGTVTCGASHFSVYTIIIKDTTPATPSPTPTPTMTPAPTTTKGSNTETTGPTVPPTNDTGEQVIEGKWNDTIANGGVIQYQVTFVREEPLIFEDNTSVMTILVSLTLAFFILMNCAFCIRY
jgi:hypothetical protein